MLDKQNISIMMTSLLYQSYSIVILNITIIYIRQFLFFVQGFSQSYLEVSVEKFAPERNSVREHLNWHQTHRLPVHQEPAQFKRWDVRRQSLGLTCQYQGWGGDGWSTSTSPSHKHQLCSSVSGRGAGLASQSFLGWFSPSAPEPRQCCTSPPRPRCRQE